MTETLKRNKNIQKNQERFRCELKMFINQQLYEKKIISEEMYQSAKEVLLKQAG